MRKFLFELGAGLTVAILIIPVCFASACIASYEAGKLFPQRIFDIFETWYREQ